MNFEYSTRMVLEVAAVSGADVPAQLAKQYIALVKEDLELGFQPIQVNKGLILEILKDAMNRKLVRYSALEEAKANSKSKKKKNIGDGGGMKQVGMKQFPFSVYWKVLQPETDVVSEPANQIFKVARAPTITEVEANYVPHKYNFSQRFAVTKFEAVKTELDLNRQGKPKKYTTTGKPIHITTPREKGCVNAAFKRN